MRNQEKPIELGQQLIIMCSRAIGLEIFAKRKNVLKNTREVRILDRFDRYVRILII